MAEKPSVAREIARILGAKTRRDGYFEGEGYQVTWAIGHLVELADTKDYGFPRWDITTLPIIPTTFKTKVTEDPGLSRQYNVIASLFGQAEEIICATDAGREGELIFRYIYLQAGSNAPFKRLWISSQTDKAIKDGFAKLKEGTAYDNLYEAARCRAEADWLVGINATQAYTLKYGNQAPFGKVGERREGPISLGRVQTPVLRLLVERWEEVQAFRAETYWELILTLGKLEQTFQAKWFNSEGERFQQEADGKVVLAKLGDTATVVSADKKPKTERPPLLYDLTELQKDANKRYNFSAQHTLDLAQELYEKYKTITYPRTDSRYLSDDIFPGIPDLLRNVAKIGTYAPWVQSAFDLGINKDTRFFNDKKVSDHHAIIPTETDPTKVSMPQEHFMLYDLIVRRLIGAFLGDCQKELSEIVLEDAGETFKAKGTMVREPGWRGIYDALEKALDKRKKETSTKKKGGEKEKESEEEKELPFVEVGEILPILQKELPQKKTKAPSIHTESSILAMMETAGKDFEDEDLREVMKDKGLGTPATRAGMIETLIKRQYITRDKKKLIPTEKGVGLVKLVRELPIASPELTGEWEFRLNKISRGEDDPNGFINEVRYYTAEIIREAKGIPKPEPLMPDYTLEESICPKCGQGKILKGKAAFGCSRYKEGCNFVIKPKIAGKFVEKEIMEDLLKNGLTQQFCQGFTSRQGKRFDARLKFGENFAVEFYFGKD